MKRTFFFLFLIFSLGLYAQAQGGDIRKIVEYGLDRSYKQALILAESMEKDSMLLPRTYGKKGLRKCNYKNWVSGFFPGVLWYLYEDRETPLLEHYARLYTERIDSAKYMKWTHDLGFILNCSYGNGYRLTGDPSYVEVMKEGARSLATRFKPTVGLIQSWGARPKWQYPVIIDNMMNLEFLLEAETFSN